MPRANTPVPLQYTPANTFEPLTRERTRTPSDNREHTHSTQVLVKHRMAKQRYQV